MVRDSESQNIKSLYVNLPFGQLHVRGVLEEDQRIPVIMLHMTPLSSVVYERALAPLARSVRPIAVDTPGFGGSDSLGRKPTIADYADVLHDLTQTLDLDRPVLLGQHTGTSIAVEFTLKQPEEARALVLSGIPCVDDEDAKRRLAGKRPYLVDERGSHLEMLWRRSRKQHPHLGAETATRHLVDELRSGSGAYLDAYTAVYTYPIEKRLRDLASTGVPVQLLYGSDDCIAGMQGRAAELLPAAEVRVLDGLTDFAADEDPELFATAIVEFLDDQGLTRATRRQRPDRRP